MRTIRRLLYAEIVKATICVALAFLSLFFFIDFVDELEGIGRNGYTLGYALLAGLLDVPWHFYELFPIAVLIGGSTDKKPGGHTGCAWVRRPIWQAIRSPSTSAGLMRNSYQLPARYMPKVSVEAGATGEVAGVTVNASRTRASNVPGVRPFRSRTTLL